MKILTLLGHLGLTKHESSVYLALLSSGPDTVAGIARNAKIERPLVYHALPDLLAKGLIAKAPKGKRTYYAALSPQRLKLLFDELGLAVAGTLPTLEKQFAQNGNRPRVTYLEGREGIIAVYDDILDTLPPRGIFYRYSSGKGGRKKNYYVPSNYQARRDAKKLERYVITSKTNAERKSPRLERATKLVPSNSDLFEYNITELIYGPKIAFVDYNTESAIIIENPIIAKFQERLFKLLYQKL